MAGCCEKVYKGIILDDPSGYHALAQEIAQRY